ncbi:hypothetical protein [Salinibacter ruber]|jgi:hypothetical protein|uniref:hypothetical protein n=1 Tax=Salinibacter ruber TaxID=146919 RepID=UPI002167C339|nr:hypothetical protein [Salinibacter ruber]MCS4103178.1 hypothetical protein [Salinibacter ruber]
MPDNMPGKGEKPTPRSLDEMNEELPPVSEAEEVVQLNVRVRKNVRKELGKLKLEKEENIEDLVDKALREYIESHE